MNNIKFKAWDNDKKEMTKVVALDWGSDGSIVTCHLEYEDGSVEKKYPDKEYGDDIEFLLYSGFKDKNNKDIYEGYIIKRKWLKGDEVKYVNEVIIFNIGAFWCSFKGRGGGELLGSHLTKVIPSQIEIIGNIYKNPELLD